MCSCSCSCAQEAITAALAACQQFADTFAPICAFYRENEAENLEALKSIALGMCISIPSEDGPAAVDSCTF